LNPLEIIDFFGIVIFNNSWSNSER
jgi:hypothetical protein